MLVNMSHVASAPVDTVPASTMGTQLSSVPPGIAVAGQNPPQGGVEMAAAMAAKINAMLMAKGKLRPLQPLPSKAPPSVLQPVSNEEIVVTEVDINDVPVNCRNLLTKGKTQEEIRHYSGAVVSTKGLYMSDAEKSANTGVERPLYLHVQGRTQDEVNKAVIRIKEIISEDVLRASGGQQPAVMPPVPVYPQPPRPPNTSTRQPNTPFTPAHRPPPPHSGTFVHTKIFVGLDQSVPSFSVNEKVEGPNGSYLQHIQTETGARVFLRGKGSGYIEQASRRESFEPLYLYISHPNSAGLDAAKKLCESLLETVRAEYTHTQSVYVATGSTQVYPAHGYSSSSSYSSQSWYGYLANGYSSAYPSYPATGGYWTTTSGQSKQNTTQTPSDTQSNTPAQGMVQYPVCPRQPAAFLLQDEGGVSSSLVNTSSSSPDSRSPKRRFIEESKEEEEETQSIPDDPVSESESSPEVSSSSDGALMPPPSAPLLPTVRKRARPEQPVLTHMDCEEEAEEEDGLKKICLDSSGLVPYGGDSSDEEEEKTLSLRKNV